MWTQIHSVNRLFGAADHANVFQHVCISAACIAINFIWTMRQDAFVHYIRCNSNKNNSMQTILMVRDKRLLARRLSHLVCTILKRFIQIVSVCFCYYVTIDVVVIAVLYSMKVCSHYAHHRPMRYNLYFIADSVAHSCWCCHSFIYCYLFSFDCVALRFWMSSGRVWVER